MTCTPCVSVVYGRIESTLILSVAFIRCSHKAGVNPEEGFFTHEVYSDDTFFKLAEAAVSFLGKTLHVELASYEIESNLCNFD